MKRYDYVTAEGCIHGEMRCSVCNKPITAGEYRVRETDDKYITHHRACTEDDPQWAARDLERAKWAKRNDDLLAASKVFRDQWSVDDLDELIEALGGEPAA